MSCLRFIAVVALSSGCARSRESAPEDMDGIVVWLFRNFEDPDLLREGMDNLAPWLVGDGSSSDAQDGFVLSDLAEEDVADVPHPDRDLAALRGVAVPGTSPYPISGHAGLLILQNQLWNDPSTYDTYDRDIVDGDTDAFAAGSGIVRTVNTIDKKGAFGVHIPYTLYKDYQWTTLTDGTTAIVGRSWVEESSCAEGGNNCLYQTFSIDLFYAPDDASTVRLTASWAELVTEADPFLSEDQLVGLMVHGIQDIFANTDLVLSGESTTAP
jgi:hypothetical protein